MAQQPPPLNQSPHGNRAWCFTLNNPSDEETILLPTNVCPTLSDHLKELKITDIAFQLEAGANETPHYQGYVRFSKQVRLSHVRRLFQRAHWEPAGGSAQQNLDYVTKLESRLSEPVIVGFGGVRSRVVGDRHNYLRRTDVLSVIADNPHVSTTELLDRGALEVLVNNPNIVGAARGLLLNDARRDGVTCDLFYGSTGTGKSRLAYHQYSDAFSKTAGPWWDQYAAEETVLFDDFDSNSLDIGEFLRIVDRYPYKVPYKGGFHRMVATHFIITSNHLPSDWWPLASKERLLAVYRRINRVYEFRRNGTVFIHDAAHFFDPSVNSLPDRFELPWNIPDTDHQPMSPMVPFVLEPATPDLTDTPVYVNTDLTDSPIIFDLSQE